MQSRSGRILQFAFRYIPSNNCVVWQEPVDLLCACGRLSSKLHQLFFAFHAVLRHSSSEMNDFIIFWCEISPQIIGIDSVFNELLKIWKRGRFSDIVRSSLSLFGNKRKHNVVTIFTGIKAGIALIRGLSLRFFAPWPIIPKFGLVKSLCTDYAYTKFRIMIGSMIWNCGHLSRSPMRTGSTKLCRRGGRRGLP